MSAADLPGVARPIPPEGRWGIHPSPTREEQHWVAPGTRAEPGAVRDGYRAACGVLAWLAPRGADYPWAGYPRCETCQRACDAHAAELASTTATTTKEK